MISYWLLVVPPTRKTSLLLQMIRLQVVLKTQEKNHSEFDLHYKEKYTFKLTYKKSALHDFSSKKVKNLKK
jgi:hypothetical protein